MSRRLLSLVLIALIAVVPSACGSDAASDTGSTQDATSTVESPASTGTDPAGTEPAATGPAATEPAATAPAATEPAATEPASSEAAAGDAPSAEPPAALTPIATCTGNLEEVYFGYDNQAAEPLVVAEGAANVLIGSMPGDNPLRTTLFAPGRVDAAFWAFRGEAASVVWTLTGPDGVERSATGDASLPRCTEEFLTDTFGDPRRPVLAITGSQLSADGGSIDVTLELTGIPPTSVCNSAFDAEPALVEIGDGSALPTGYEPSTTIGATFFPSPDGAGQLASAVVTPLVVDQCSAAGVTVRSWSVAPELRALAFGSVVCARIDDAGTLTVELFLSPCGLPTTGGSSIRPN